MIFHESCGHSLEATRVAYGLSEFAGKKGQQIANEKVTAVDDGTIANAWGSINIDDEGTPSQKNILIERTQDGRAFQRFCKTSELSVHADKPHDEYIHCRRQ